MVGDIIYIYNHPIGNIYIYIQSDNHLEESKIFSLPLALGCMSLHFAPLRGGRRWFQDGESGGNCPVPRGFGSPKRSRG